MLAWNLTFLALLLLFWLLKSWVIALVKFPHRVHDTLLVVLTHLLLNSNLAGVCTSGFGLVGAGVTFCDVNSLIHPPPFPLRESMLVPPLLALARFQDT